jgi:hypothetical protein
MFKNFGPEFDKSVDQMEDNAISIDIEQYNRTLPKGITPETVVKVADHYRQYTTETATNFVRVAKDFDAGDYTVHAETPFGVIECAITSDESDYELTISNHISMEEYRGAIDKLFLEVSEMDLSEPIIDEDEAAE